MVKYFSEKRDVRVVVHKLVECFQNKFSLLNANLFQAIPLVQEGKHMLRHRVLGPAQLNLWDVMFLFWSHHFRDYFFQLLQREFFFLNGLWTAEQTAAETFSHWLGLAMVNMTVSLTKLYSLVLFSELRRHKISQVWRTLWTRPVLAQLLQRLCFLSFPQNFGEGFAVCRRNGPNFNSRPIRI